MKAYKAVRCPNCEYQLTWAEGMRCSRCLGFARRRVSCPSCGVDLIWTKWPWRIATVGAITLIPANLIAIMLIKQESATQGIACVLALIPFIMFVAGAMLLKLELIDSVNHALENTP